VRDAHKPPHLPIAWAQQQSEVVARTGRALTPEQVKLARAVGVQDPARIRVLTVEQFPLPQQADVKAAALRIRGFALRGRRARARGHALETGPLLIARPRRGPRPEHGERFRRNLALSTTTR